MKLVVTAVSATLILWRRASALESPTDVPPSTLPAREVAPVRANIASRSVVFPLWKGPTSAMHRGPRGLLTSCPIAVSSSGARPLIGSAHGWSPHIEDLASRKTSLQCILADETIRGRDGDAASATKPSGPFLRSGSGCLRAYDLIGRAAVAGNNEKTDAVSGPAAVPGF